MTRILITEDDPFVARIYQSKFQAEGFDVSMAGDGRAAIRQLTANPPDVVLLDLMLPEINGVEVLKFIRSKESLRDLPVLVLSSAVAGELIQAAKNAGASKLLSKAMCSPRHVVDEVRSAMAAHVPTPVGGDSEDNVRAAFEGRVPPLISRLSPLLEHLLKSAPASRGPAVLELRRAAHTLSSNAALAGLTNIVRMSSSLEMLLTEVQANPRRVTPSTMRTVRQVVDFIPSLLKDRAQNTSAASPLILVLDDDFISRAAVCAALEQANFRALSFEDPLLALRVMELNRFDLIFLDVDMPRMSGLDMCRKLRGMPINADTPVIFVTGYSDFETRAQSELAGATDFIAKPIIPIELAVKGLMHLLRQHGEIRLPSQAAA